MSDSVPVYISSSQTSKPPQLDLLHIFPDFPTSSHRSLLRASISIQNSKKKKKSSNIRDYKWVRSYTTAVVDKLKGKLNETCVEVIHCTEIVSLEYLSQQSQKLLVLKTCF